MGKSAPPPAPFDLINSYARSRGSAVEIVLNGPEVPAVEMFTEAVLRRGGATVTGRVVHDEGPFGPRLVVTVDRQDLGDGRWKLRLRGSDVEPMATRTRLLVQGRRPLVLLWGGADPESRLPDPRARTGVAAAPDVRTTVVRAGSRALDVALSPLPEDKRRQARQRARRVARRVLG